jgi:hypothetical protein
VIRATSDGPDRLPNTRDDLSTEEPYETWAYPSSETRTSSGRQEKVAIDVAHGPALVTRKARPIAVLVPLNQLGARTELKPVLRPDARRRVHLEWVRAL